MANWYGYIGVENLNLTPPQRDTLIDGLQKLGRDEDNPQPSRRLQWRTRTDNQAVIFEATFDDADLTTLVWRQRLATLFGVNVSTIVATVNTPGFGTGTTVVVTFSRTSINYLRVALFGGTSATHEQSRIEALAYLTLNQVAWEE